MSERRAVSIILPAYNNRDLLARYLPLVVAEVDRRRAGDEIIVVDDAGQDDTQGLLAREFPQVRYIRNPVNGGFGAACNLGIEASTRPYILLLNTDVEVSAGFMDPLLRHFDDANTFGVAPRVVRPTDPPECQSLTSFEFRSGFFQLIWDEHGAPRHSQPVLFPCGACALFDAAKLRELGGVDPLYRPFYTEDVDLGYVAWKRGWRCLYEPSVTVLHCESVTVLKKVTARRRSVINTRNNYLFVWKNFSDWRLLSAHVALMPLRAASALVKRRDPTLLLGLLSALPRLPEAIRARRRLRGQVCRTDREVADLVGFLP